MLFYTQIIKLWLNSYFPQCELELENDKNKQQTNPIHDLTLMSEFIDGTIPTTFNSFKNGSSQYMKSNVCSIK